jgi:hypothetical protein
LLHFVSDDPAGGVSIFMLGTFAPLLPDVLPYFHVVKVPVVGIVDATVPVI